MANSSLSLSHKDLFVESHFELLSTQLEGSLHWDNARKILYATDASAYREMPSAVAFPASDEDISKLIAFATKHSTSLIPRTAGTSLAGQVVGSGIIVDVSQTLNQILEINPDEKWVRVQPGVIRDDLNYHLKPFKLLFGPETSTSNRAMIGGMVGNNSCGSNSILYGSTREHLLEVKGFLSDGSPVHFKSLSDDEFEEKLKLDNLEGALYRHIQSVLGSKEARAQIDKEFPKKSIPRRNTGYALDELMAASVFGESKDNFNFCKLLAGSEGTLIFMTEIKVALEPLPPAYKGLLAIHLNDLYESFDANLVALEYRPSASELIDHYILELTKENFVQKQNRFFLQGDPKAILVVALERNSQAELEAALDALISELKSKGMGYHYPKIYGDDIKKVWSLRKAGLGLLANMPGDAKPVPVIEDTAVDVRDLSNYIRDFNQILDENNLQCVHYAHIGTGELHLRPIINFKTAEGNQQFRMIAEEVAKLVKKYKGSLSGEHGDGRLRGEFIPLMVGEQNFKLFKELKRTWDPKNIFNPGKIVDTPSMNSNLRYDPGQITPQFETYFDYSSQGGILRAAEKCNGSGDCRKTEISGGTMCPSYMATRNEKDTTRARANILREMLTKSTKDNPFDHKEIKEVMDLCLSCKGCKSECPSNVDMANLKAEFLQKYHDANGVPLRSRLIANFPKLNRLAMFAPRLFNLLANSKFLGGLGKKMIGFAVERQIPELSPYTLRSWFNKHNQKLGKQRISSVIFFCDEFTNFNDVEIGKKAILLLNKLGYEVQMPEHEPSARTYLSKGLLRDARKIVNKNLSILGPLVNAQTPLLGVEPSAILTFRDEYPELVRGESKKTAKALASNAFMIEEFLSKEVDAGRITSSDFTKDKQNIRLHGHCQQKAVASLVPTKKVLNLPDNYNTLLIPSGCCGMAGSFGYEAEHFEVSMKIGNLVLFPTIKTLEKETIIAAPGTSCRHQIKDGTSRQALHPVEILFNALNVK